ncbi:hypothetical protein [Rhodoferax ferrireducens]|uniref:hypothetical protein n=1 Tax=Rhodoferax ferrireducens TaxID=192843 RepID=UPI00130041CB|nr:hypothetical protein [Rhodoferax ferrireducens]
MKTLLLVLAVAGLSGCAVYPAAPYETYGPSAPYVVAPPLYIHGSVVYQNAYPRATPHVYPRGYYRARPGMRDRDHDGVPNRFDRRPHDPRRR